MAISDRSVSQFLQNINNGEIARFRRKERKGGAETIHNQISNGSTTNPTRKVDEEPGRCNDNDERVERLCQRQ